VVISIEIKGRTRIEMRNMFGCFWPSQEGHDFDRNKTKTAASYLFKKQKLDASADAGGQQPYETKFGFLKGHTG
jgi:hypothetical protein